MSPLELNIAVLKGGISTEREVSLRSGQAVASALRQRVASVVEIDIQSQDFTLPEDVDFAFIALHGAFGEDGGVQEVLENKGIAYSGAGVLESRKGFDKILSKECFVRAQVKTPTDEILRKPENTLRTLSVPVVIKPPCQGSSVGIEIVREEALLGQAIARGYSFCDELLVESFHQGRELTVGIIGTEILPVVEIKPKSGFYDYANKYTKGASEYKVPARLTPEQEAIVKQEAWKAFHSLGENMVYGRTDIILDDQDNAWVLEVNTIPGMTETSLLPKSAEAVGISYTDLCIKIIEQSLIARAKNGGIAK